MTVKIDLSNEDGKPHWLSPAGNPRPSQDAIREKHRARFRSRDRTAKNYTVTPKAQPSLADVLPQLADLISKSVTEAVAAHAQATRDLIAGMHKADQKNMQRLITAITAPKKIVHDDDGRPVGLESDHGE